MAGPARNGLAHRCSPHLQIPINDQHQPSFQAAISCSRTYKVSSGIHYPAPCNVRPEIECQWSHPSDPNALKHEWSQLQSQHGQGQIRSGGQHDRLEVSIGIAKRYSGSMGIAKSLISRPPESLVCKELRRLHSKPKPTWRLRLSGRPGRDRQSSSTFPVSLTS